jgi:hypothetical protein
MNRVYAPLTVLTLFASVAAADLVEVQATGFFQSSSVGGNATTDLAGQEWQLSFVYEQSEIFAGTALRSAVFTYGDQSIVLDINAASGNVFGSNARDDDPFNYDSITFGFVLDGHSLGLSLHADSGWWYHPSDGSPDWHSSMYPEFMPTNYTLDDFSRYDMSMGLPETHNPDSMFNIHYHFMQITSLSARVVPSPAGLAAFGLVGLAASRRRR